jgi:hypothetical protein
MRPLEPYRLRAPLERDEVRCEAVEEPPILRDDARTSGLRVPYPLGFFTKWLDGRIDDPNADWKGGLWATVSTRRPFHMEGGRGTTSKVVKFQLVLIRWPGERAVGGPRSHLRVSRRVSSTHTSSSETPAARAATSV